MLVGIDIGGTFTDIAAVDVDSERIMFQHKVPTTVNILDCVLEALDRFLQQVDKHCITRLCISTTLVTNAIIKNQLPPTTLLVLPGPGVNCEQCFPVPAHIISGYINHMGNSTASPDLSELSDLVPERNIAISGKFSVRNPEHEQLIAEHLRGIYPDSNIITAHSLSGQLNFIRRTNTAYYAAATQDIWSKFVLSIRQAVAARGLDIPLTILKADAGTIDINHAAANTAELVFTGPAASVLGIKALISQQDECIALDIGGTTTDISCWRDGEAILNYKGAQINGFNTSINTFYLHSFGLGGNSLIQVQPDGSIAIGPHTSMDCVCLGGAALTLTDILCLLGRIELGDAQLVYEYLAAISLGAEFAESVFAQALDTLSSKLYMMIEDINKTPVYTVGDLTQPHVFRPIRLIGVGGAASGIVPNLAAKMGMQCSVPESAPVANALGAALARPTLLASLHANTLSGYYTLSQDDTRYPTKSGFNTHTARSILLKHMHILADAAGIQLNPDFIDVIELEEYPILAGNGISGVVINMTMQIKPDILINYLD